MKIQTLFLILSSLFVLAIAKTANYTVNGKVSRSRHFYRNCTIKFFSVSQENDKKVANPLGEVQVAKPYYFNYSFLDKNFNEQNNTFVIEVTAKKKFRHGKRFRFTGRCAGYRCSQVLHNPAMKLNKKEESSESNPKTKEVKNPELAKGKESLDESKKEYTSCYKFIGFVVPEYKGEKDGVSYYMFKFMKLKFGWKSLKFNGKKLMGIKTKCS